MTPSSEASLEEQFRLALRRLASGISVLTYLDGSVARGMTATAVCSVSASPPKLLACVNRQARTRDRILEAGDFAVNFLAASHRLLSEFCAVPRQEKAVKPQWLQAGSSHPAITGALAHLQCTVEQVYEEATHSIIIGAVVRIQIGRSAAPLVYFEGGYHTVTRTPGNDQTASAYDALLKDLIHAYS